QELASLVEAAQVEIDLARALHEDRDVARVAGDRLLIMGNRVVPAAGASLDEEQLGEDIDVARLLVEGALVHVDRAGVIALDAIEVCSACKQAFGDVGLQ